MRDNLLFFYLYVNYPSLPHFCWKILLYFVHADETKGLFYMDIKNNKMAAILDEGVYDSNEF